MAVDPLLVYLPMTIDLKSLAVGLVLGISIALSIAATKPKEGAVGRFQIGISGDSSIYKVIDTQTGEVWSNDKPKLEVPHRPLS